MLMVGITTIVLGICATAITVLNNRIIQEAPARNKVTKPKMLSPSIWAIGFGIILTIIGSIVGSTYEKGTVTNTAGLCNVVNWNMHMCSWSFWYSIRNPKNGFGSEQ